MTKSNKETIMALLSTGFISSKQIQKATNLSQTSVNKYLQKIDQMDLLVKIDTKRPPLYTIALDVPGIGSVIKVSSVDENGKTDSVNFLRPVVGGGFVLEKNTSTPEVYLGANKDGYFEGIPYFIDDMRPQGFIGAHIVKKVNSKDSRFPADIRIWNQNHILKYLITNHTDAPGNLIISRLDQLVLANESIPVSRKSYEIHVKSMLKGQMPQSSAGGEQRKFLAFSEEMNSHVMVKFTSKGDDPVTRRWKDILITEHYASKTLNQFNIPAAESELFEMNGRIFLEVKRFDRHGLTGRSSLVSLQAINNEFLGVNSEWPEIAQKLFALNLINELDRAFIDIIWNFGKSIFNTDMHTGNISFSVKNNRFSLLPIYDMCSMGLAPLDQLQPIEKIAPKELRKITIKGIWINAGNEFELVKPFWEAVYSDVLISEEFKAYIGSILSK